VSCGCGDQYPLGDVGNRRSAAVRAWLSSSPAVPPWSLPPATTRMRPTTGNGTGVRDGSTVVWLTPGPAVWALGYALSLGLL